MIRMDRKGFTSLAEITSTDTLESLCLRNGEEAKTLPSTGKPGEKFIAERVVRPWHRLTREISHP